MLEGFSQFQATNTLQLELMLWSLSRSTTTSRHKLRRLYWYTPRRDRCSVRPCSCSLLAVVDGIDAGCCRLCRHLDAMLPVDLDPVWCSFLCKLPHPCFGSQAHYCSVSKHSTVGCCDAGGYEPVELMLMHQARPSRSSFQAQYCMDCLCWWVGASV